ncbi:hypothetical protein NEOLEDRAFT_765535 [Neolentinus lepideus HHB14362 ss-1]|uniref:Uncharacterized protein n=1 Tax=Neolentinus lepideus HHB14362 ss-1 TaxID=1314782 RepID=A0A165PQ51_9AGAM|nr:hypothetical protein NEOLEDRAFT_765535 [Neolentinus lepideus HHB14362 ss-1]
MGGDTAEHSAGGGRNGGGIRAPQWVLMEIQGRPPMRSSFRRRGRWVGREIMMEPRFTNSISFQNLNGRLFWSVKKGLPALRTYERMGVLGWQTGYVYCLPGERRAGGTEDEGDVLTGSGLAGVGRPRRDIGGTGHQREGGTQRFVTRRTCGEDM